MQDAESLPTAGSSLVSHHAAASPRVPDRGTSPTPRPHAFIDVSTLSQEKARDVVRSWTTGDALCPFDVVTVHAPVNFDDTGLAAVIRVAGEDWRNALRVAATTAASLLVVTGDCQATNGSVAQLEKGLTSDALIGVAHPRFLTETGHLLPVVDSVREEETLEAGILGSAPDAYLTTGYLSPCLLFSGRVLAGLPLNEQAAASLLEALRDLTIRMQRVGFRTLVCNRALVQVGRHPATVDGSGLPPGIALSSGPDRRQPHFGRLSTLAREMLISKTFERPWPLLLDGRNLTASIDGTAKVVLGLAEALLGCDRTRATMWVSDGAAAAHRLHERFPNLRIVTHKPDERFGVALRLGQPWVSAEVLDLHELACANVYVMLDTIAWDVVYPSPPHLDTTWRLTAATADGIIFISRFSAERFLHRFPTGPDVLTAVVHLSLDPADYRRDGTLPDGIDPGYWFIVGNNHDHKHVGPTLQLLGSTFPEQRIVVLGSHRDDRGPVVGMPSGAVTEPVVQGLYAHASVLIYPSFYEGFGLPIMNALAYDRIVVARDSALVREIAEEYSGPGRLLVYETDAQLLDSLRALSAGARVNHVPLRRERLTAPHGWHAAARQSTAFMEQAMRRSRQRPSNDLRDLATALRVEMTESTLS